jgi:chromosome segregation ATPase
MADEIEKLKAENAELREKIEDWRAKNLQLELVQTDIKAQLSESQKKVEESIDFIVKYGGIDGAHHKDWVLDQTVRKLSGDNYSKIIADAKAGEDGPDTYEWEEGIAP